MKKIYALLFSLLVISSAYSQKVDKENLPKKVLIRFQSDYSKATNVTWELDFETYVASFDLLKETKTAYITKDGELLKTITPINSTELPKLVKESFTREVGGILVNYSFESIEKIEFPNKDNWYKIEIKKVQEIKTLMISEKGEVMKNEAEKKE